MTARHSQAGRANLMATLFRIISNARLSASLEGVCEFTGPDGRTQAFTLSRNAHTLMSRINFRRPRVG
jgi:hypothetical protein